MSAKHIVLMRTCVDSVMLHILSNRIKSIVHTIIDHTSCSAKRNTLLSLLSMCHIRHFFLKLININLKLKIG